MFIELVPQIQLGPVQRVRVGDVLNNTIADSGHSRFRFAVAYMRLSGWDRLSVSVESLVNRGGKVSGAVGIDDEITSLEALEALRQVSEDSTVFHTTSQLLYHPKFYLMSGLDRAVAVVGSANLTRDGLFRNVEVATAVHMDLGSSVDNAVYKRYDDLINEFLNISNPNVRPIDQAMLDLLTKSGAIKSETQVPEPNQMTKGKTLKAQREISDSLKEYFPPLRVPVAPPLSGSPQSKSIGRTKMISPPTTMNLVGTFVMQLSPFDSSHRVGVKGTAEVLIPHEAVNFFPQLTISGRKYPDALFDVILNTPFGPEKHAYRFWYYEERATGSRIDEYRLRMDKETIELSTPGGGDLLVINRMPPGSKPLYEVTVLPQTDPTFPAFLSMCTKRIYDKIWGILK